MKLKIEVYVDGSKAVTISPSEIAELVNGSSRAKDTSCYVTPRGASRPSTVRVKVTRED